MFVESVAGHYGGGLRSHWFLGPNWQRHAWLHFNGHRAATLERHARKPAQTNRAVALAAGSAGEVAHVSGNTPDSTRHANFLPLECREPVRSCHAVLYCVALSLPSLIPDVVCKSLYCTFSVFCVVSSLLMYNIYFIVNVVYIVASHF